MATVHMPANAVHRQMLLESSEKRNLARTIIHCNCQQADFPFTDTPHGRDLCNAVKSMLEQYGGDFALWSKGHQVPLQGPMLPSQISHSVEVNVGIMTKWMWKCTAMAWNTASSLSLMVAHFKNSIFESVGPANAHVHCGISETMHPEEWSHLLALEGQLRVHTSETQQGSWMNGSDVHYHLRERLVSGDWTKHFLLSFDFEMEELFKIANNMAVTPKNPGLFLQQQKGTWSRDHWPICRLD